jgi:hypothetical protein
LIGNKDLSDEGHNTISENKSTSNKKFWITLGLVTLFGVFFSIWYFEMWTFGGNSPGTGGGSSSSASTSANASSSSGSGSGGTSNLATFTDSHLDNPHRIKINPGQKTIPVNDAVAQMDQSMESFNKDNP